MPIEKELKMKFRNVRQKARLNLYMTNSYLGETFTQMLKQANLTGSQFNILRILRGQESKQLCIGEIKSRMIDKSSDVSRLVDKLVAKKLTERKENPEDRRQKNISITKKGLEVLASLDHTEEDMDNRMNALSDKELNTLNELLEKIRHSKQDK